MTKEVIVYITSSISVEVDDENGTLSNEEIAEYVQENISEFLQDKQLELYENAISDVPMEDIQVMN